MSSQHQRSGPSRVARTIRRLSVPIILAWLGITIFMTMGVPPLEQVAKEHSVSMYPLDAPYYKALTRMNADFKQSGSGGGQSDPESSAMIVLEGEQRLGDDAHAFYDRMIAQFTADRVHVRHVQNFWGDKLTRAAAQSADGKAAYVQVNLAGTLGQASGNESVEALRRIVERTPAPPGIKAYVTGPAAIAADMGHSGDRTLVRVTAVSLLVIVTMLFFVYRSIVTVILSLLMVGIELQVARGTVAFLGHQGVIGFNTFASNLLVSLVIAAGTDYAIFFIGRYQEARQAGEDKETAYFTTFRGVAKVIVASGLTIAGAVFCLSFTRLPSFRVLGVPCAVGVTVAVAVAVTLIPAVLTAGSRIGLFERKRAITFRGWRRVGTAIVRWPAPVLVASMAVALVGLLTLPGFKPNYDDRQFIPKNISANLGYDAAARHFPSTVMWTPGILLVEADHDLRDPADFLVLEKLAKGVLAVPGISRVQSVTRPEGTPIAHTTLPYMLSMQESGQKQFMHFQKMRMDDILKQADTMAEAQAILQTMYGLTQQMFATTHDMVHKTHDMQELSDQLRQNLANFEDFFRPIRSYFYWENHCYDIPVCWAVRNLFEPIDGADMLVDKLGDVVKDLDQIDVILPQILTQFPQMIAITQSSRDMLLKAHATMAGTTGQMEDANSNPSAMGKAFDSAKNDDSFYLPPEVLKNKDFQRVMDIFLSADGKAARMFVQLKDDPASPEGMSRVDAIKNGAGEALKGTPLEDSRVYLSGTAAVVKDVVQGSAYDLAIAGVAALCLIFIVMLVITRSFVAASVIVGTVVLSLGASFGLSVLVWQYLLGIQLHWAVLVMSVIVLLAVGSDYNLLLVARMKEELGAGINTGIIRAMGGTGKLVTYAGLVFALTMGSLIVSDLRSIGQLGTTIALGLLFDTLVVRAFMTPSIAALLGRWFWWPQHVRPRPASTMLRPTGPRPLVRALLLR
ncbi:MAG: RND family transporter [Mycobacterium sp.]